MLRFVVFDFDGTLVDSNLIKRQSFFEVAADFEDGERRMESLLARDDAGDRYWIFEHFVDDADNAKALSDRYTHLCEQKIVAAAEMPGAGLALKALKASGMKLFVNSATPVGPLERIIELRGMSSWFDGVYGAPEGKVENIQSIMNRYGVDRSAIAMVGDGEADRLAAERVGCRFVAVVNPQNNFDKTPDYKVCDLRELPARLGINTVAARRVVGSD